MTPEARKQLLILACTIDRLEIMRRWGRDPATDAGLAGAVQGPWIPMVAMVAGRLLPRRFRLLVTLLRAFTRG